MNTLHIIMDAVNLEKVKEMDFLSSLMDKDSVHTGELDCGFPDCEAYQGMGHTVSSGLSLITGQTPTKDGHLVNRFMWDKPAVPSMKFSSHREIDQTDYIWDYLTIRSVKQGYVNLPVVYPPENVHGFMITGVMSVSRFAYPKKLEDKLRKGYCDTEHQDFPLHGNANLPYIIDFDKAEISYSTLKELAYTMPENRTDHSLKLIDKYDPEYFFVWYTAPDRLFHHTSMHGDQDHDSRVMNIMDEQLEYLIDKADADHLIIHSDHGFQHEKNAHDRHGFYMVDSPYKWIGKDTNHILDIPPTVMSTLDLEIPEQYEGTSLLWSERDQEVMEGRLDNMGYLDKEE